METRPLKTVEVATFPCRPRTLCAVTIGPSVSANFSSACRGEDAALASQLNQLIKLVVGVAGPVAEAVDDARLEGGILFHSLGKLSEVLGEKLGGRGDGG